MAQHTVEFEVAGPWSLATSREFWEEFAPLGPASAAGADEALRTVFHADADWRRVAAEIRQYGSTAQVVVAGDGDLGSAAEQVRRFLSLDVDARGWPTVAERDPVIADVQARWPGLRPCGFHSPYEAATWAVLTQRTGMTSARRMRDDLVARYGTGGAFPSPEALLGLDFELPWRKTEYLRSVSRAALDGLLDGARLRTLDPGEAVRQVQQIKGLGTFSAELVVVRGANHPDTLPTQERRLEAEITEQYGPGRSRTEVSENWRPYRTWAALHLRVLRAERMSPTIARPARAGR
ncbi:DNA-3-methyladenine glycosylase II [Streptomyces albiflavescens]|uniref:DNA-3-methyladenine glycosylase II n=1 Tax=Streptomyces albiflavescens TaxID=1623582 RepID=A0A917YCR8_9ACTN|nr:DNA-3-methyladenine glycosylase 2 family protein [Streptomyces albiflavescens]GGN86647.1 DNA-3-methyladenine glycosylase II [Streptomyces albiflavescens]